MKKHNVLLRREAAYRIIFQHELLKKKKKNVEIILLALGTVPEGMFVTKRFVLDFVSGLQDGQNMSAKNYSSCLSRLSQKKRIVKKTIKQEDADIYGPYIEDADIYGPNVNKPIFVYSLGGEKASLPACIKTVNKEVLNQTAGITYQDYLDEVAITRLYMQGISAENYGEKYIALERKYNALVVMRNKLVAKLLEINSSFNKHEFDDLIQPVLDQPVGEINLSARTLNCFREMDIKTVGQIISCTSSQLLISGNFKRKELEETDLILSEMGLSLGGGSLKGEDTR